MFLLVHTSISKSINLYLGCMKDGCNIRLAQIECPRFETVHPDIDERDSENQQMAAQSCDEPVEIPQA